MRENEGLTKEELLERLQDQEMKNSQLEVDLNGKEREIEDLRSDVNWYKNSRLDTYLTAVIVLAVCFIVGFPVVMRVLSPGTVQFCYIDTSHHTLNSGEVVEKYYLEASVDWAEDRTLTTCTSLLECKSRAEALNCPLK